MLNAAALLPFCECDLSLPVHDHVMCSDAEGQNRVDVGGGAVVSCKVSPAELDFLSVQETCPGKNNASVHGWVTQTRESKRWKRFTRRRWRFKEHINLGELEAVLLGVRKLTSGSLPIECCEIVWMTDNSVTFYCLKKGRSSKPTLRARLKRLTGLLLVHNLRLNVKWVASRFCAADGESRRR